MLLACVNNGKPTRHHGEKPVLQEMGRVGIWSALDQAELLIAELLLLGWESQHSPGDRHPPPAQVLYPLSSQHPNKLCGCAGSAPSTLARRVLVCYCLQNVGAAGLSCVCASRVDVTEAAVIECYIPRLLRYGYSKVLQLFSRS